MGWLRITLPPSPPDAATRPVAALAPERREEGQELGQEATRNLSEKRRAGRRPHSLVVV